MNPDRAFDFITPFMEWFALVLVIFLVGAFCLMIGFGIYEMLKWLWNRWQSDRAARWHRAHRGEENRRASGRFNEPRR